MANIELRKEKNFDCLQKCTKEKRNRLFLDDMCTELLSVIDKQPLRCVGEWAEKKIFHLVQYFGIFSQGMSKKWNGLNYIEICSGPGRCINRSDGVEFDGTALAIARHDNLKYINKALFFDINREAIAILNKRFSEIRSNKLRAYLGDYTDSETICSIIRTEIPTEHLNFVFIDPTDCSVPLKLVRDLKEELKNVDFVINVATGTDFNRNIIGALTSSESYRDSKNKYISFLGGEEFFSDPIVHDLAYQKDNIQLRLKFREYYTAGLRSIGMNFFDFKPVKHYYDLIFASSSNKGLELWNKAHSITYSGQRELLF